ncbi:hypothetical protein AHAS_Ahas01G0034600 [Arachis hypogaea]
MPKRSRLALSETPPTLTPSNSPTAQHTLPLSSLRSPSNWPFLSTPASSIPPFHSAAGLLLKLVLTSHSHHFHFHTNCFTNTIHTETKSSKNKTIFFFFKPSSKFQSLTTQARLASSIHPLSPPPPSTNHAILDSKHTTLLVEAYHVHRGLGILLRKLDSIDGDPLRILTEDGDWPKEYFWAVVKFLKNASRFSEILQVFDMWKNIEKLRISELKYNKIISLLVEGGMMEGAMSILQEMKIHGLKPSLDTYNPIIHGFSREGKFGEALCFLDEMKEFDLEPDTETYDGLIRAYGKFKMYDEIGKCKDGVAVVLVLLALFVIAG